MMKNGNAFRTFTDETRRFLAGLKVVIDYDVNLKQFGWQEQKTPDGVWYKFSW